MLKVSVSNLYWLWFFHIPFAILTASIIKRAVNKDWKPTKMLKNVENKTPPYKNTYGIIKGPVPNITFIIITIVINEF